MDILEILKKVDHTLLSTTATWSEIKGICDDGLKYGVASVCIPPSYVARAKAYLDGRLAVCTVIGFPNGYNTTEAKVFEAQDALAKGADEIDMVVNRGWVKDGDFAAVEQEIRALKAVAGEKILKVIIEACLMTDAEKIALCQAVTNAGADFIKTSTGFSTGGATREDVKLFAEHIGDGVFIKAAGGIKTLQDAEDFIALGASRLGTSSIVKVLKNQAVSGY